MASEFYFPYCGNKRNEYDHIKSFLPEMQNIHTIVEPFCGSCAVSFKIWKNADENKKYHMNDINSYLINFYKMIQEDKKEEILNELEQFKKITKEEWNKIMRKKEKSVSEFILEKVWAKNLMCPIGYKPFPKLEKFRKKIPYDEFIKHSHLTNQDHISIFEQYKNDDNAFLFLDPPYINSNNDEYKMDGVNFVGNMEELFLSILDILKNGKCKVMLVVNNRLLMKLLFKDFIKNKYEKTYSRTHKKDEHLIICNF